MAFSINTNILALQNQRELGKSQKSLGNAFERLSSGKRINHASDDASGLQIAESQRADVATYTVAMRNVNDSVSMMNIADGTLETGSSILTRMNELAEQAANGTLSDSQRSALNDEYQALKSELDRTQQTAEFNGKPVTGETTFQTGIDGSGDSQTTVNITAVSSGSLGVADANLSNQAAARDALTKTTAAIQTVAQSRGDLGAVESRMDATLSNLGSQRQLVSQSLSTKEDADIAEESGNLTAAKIKQQMNASLAAHANLNQEQVLKLLG